MTNLLPPLLLILAPGASETASAVLRDVRIASPHLEAATPACTVLVERGAITWIGAPGDEPSLEGASVFEGEGRFLAPGFCDMHVHLPGHGGELPVEFLDEALEMMLRKGITTARVARGEPALLDVKRAVERGELPGPRLLVAAPPLRSSAFPTLDEARESFAIWSAQGYDAIKFLSAPEGTDYAAYVAAAREAGLPWYGHAPFEGLEVCALEGQVSVEHLSAVSRLRHADPDALAPALEALATAGVSLCPDLDFYYVYSDRATTEELTGRAGLGELPHGTVTRWTEELLVSDPRRRQMTATLQVFLDAVPEVRASGVNLVLSPSDGRFVVPGHSFAVEAGHLAEAGFTPAEILAMATVNAARCLGEQSRRGTVEVGRRADLVLLDADPFASAEALGSVRAVWLAGRLVSGGA